MAVIEKHAPLRRLRVSGKDNPWFNDTIAASIRERDNAWTKAKINNDPRSWDTYRAFRINALKQ